MGQGKPRCLSRTFTLTFPLPPSVNNLYLNARHGGRIKAPAYRAWEKLADGYALAVRRECLQGDLRAVYNMGKPSGRRMDLANREKATTDALVRWGIMTDDCQLVELTMRWSDEVEKGFVRVEVSAAS